MKQRAASVPRRKSTVVTPVHASMSPVAGSAGLSGQGHSDDVHTRIAVVAYRLYEQRGRHDGHDVEDWLMAERLVVGTGKGSTAEMKETP